MRTTDEQRKVVEMVGLNNEGFIDDDEYGYETYGSTAEAQHEGGYINIQKEVQLFDMKAQEDAKSFVESYEESVKETEQAKLKEEWTHVGSQSEEIQRAIVDNISIKIVFQSLMDKHKKFDTSAFELSERRIPSKEAQHLQMYKELMNDLIETAEYIEAKERIINALRT